MEDLCQLNPCLFDGVCSQRGLAFHCHCVANKTGQVCEDEIDDALQIYGFSDNDETDGLYFRNYSCQDQNSKEECAGVMYNHCTK